MSEPRRNKAESNRVPSKDHNTLGPVRAQGLGDLEPELKGDEPARFEEAGPTITRQGPDGVDKTRVGTSINTMGPVSGDGLYGLAPELADGRPATKKPSGPTKPCEGCGWPVELSASICTHCGHDKRTGQSKSTEIGEEAKPAALPDLRFQTYMHDPKLSRRSWANAAAILVLGLVALLLAASILTSAASSAGAPAAGPSIPGMYLGKFSIGLLASTGFYIGACYLFIDYLGPLVLAVIRLGAALACADAVQRWFELLQLITPNFFIIGIVFGGVAAMALYVALAAELLDIDFQEAILFTAVVYMGKLFLSLTVYPAIF
jgi:hypothetical protein